jgi:hypothetical protein
MASGTSLRNFTATAVKEHLRSQIEDIGGVPNLTDKEVELVRRAKRASGRRAALRLRRD